MARNLTAAESDVQFKAVWDAALRQFYETTHRKLDDAYLPRPISMESLKAEIDKQQQGFSAFRLKRKDVFESLTYALKPVELLGNLAAGAASNVSEMNRGQVHWRLLRLRFFCVARD